MLVKRIAELLAIFFFLCGCGNEDRVLLPGLSTTELSPLGGGPHVSLLSSPSGKAGLFAFSSDTRSSSLVVREIALIGGLPSSAPPAPPLFQKLDDTPTQADDFGMHAAAVIGDRVFLLYVERLGDERRILKTLVREGDGSWTLDTMEPPGIPLAIIGDETGTPIAFWADGSLYARGILGRGTARSALPGFMPASRGCPAGDGFTVFDLASKRLLFISFKSGEISYREIIGGTALHSSLEKDGKLFIATYDPATRSIRLVEQSDGDDVVSSLVARTDGTSALAILPYGGSLILLYDEIERLSRRDWAFALTLLVPNGKNYVRNTLLRCSTPIHGFQAVMTGNALYVLVSSDSLRLLHAELP